MILDFLKTSLYQGMILVGRAPAKGHDSNCTFVLAGSSHGKGVATAHLKGRRACGQYAHAHAPAHLVRLQVNSLILTLLTHKVHHISSLPNDMGIYELWFNVSTW